MKHIIHIKACTRYIHSLNKNKFSSLWSCGLSWYTKTPCISPWGLHRFSDFQQPDWNLVLLILDPVGFHCSAIQYYFIFFFSFSFTEIELTCTAEWIDLHRPWNGYHSKFSERPSSHIYTKKKKESKLFLCDGNSYIYCADNCQI